jgi:hypothetical protein
MNNPLSTKPGYELFPYPQGCTGYRIWQMLRDRRPDVTRLEYLRGFERANLVNGIKWDRRKAEQAAVNLPSLYRGRTVLVFGDGPRKALRLPKKLIHPVEQDGVTWRQLPHPSGRCHWYNNKECRALAALLLEELYNLGAE